MISLAEPNMLNHIIRPSYLSVRGSFLFIGTDDGTLQLHERCSGGGQAWSPFIRHSALLTRYVCDIAWSPLDVNRFAVAGNDKFIYVMEFEPADRNWTTQHTFTANAEKASVTSLKWSQTQKHLLLSFHIEGKVCLWSTNEPEKPPLTITYHCPMWCGMFLPSNENIIMCSGKAISIELIDIKNALAENEKTICSKVDALLNVKWASKSLNQPYAPVLSKTDKKRQRRDQRKAATRQEAEAAKNEAVKTKETEAATKEKPTENSLVPETPVEVMLQGLSLDKQHEVTKECMKCKELESDYPPDSLLIVGF